MTSVLPFPAVAVFIIGWFSSLGLWKLIISTSFSFGSSSAMARPSMLFPVPGSPISSTCLLCVLAFFITLIASSCPMTWSISLSFTLSSAVVLNENPFFDVFLVFFLVMLVTFYSFS